VDSTEIAALIAGADGFVRTLGPQVVRSGPAEALLRLPADERLHNHLGGPHAAAVFGLGETTAFVVLLEVFGDLVEAGAVPLVKAAEIAYTAVATGPLLATGRLAADADRTAVRASLDARGVAVFAVRVAFTREQDGVETAVMTAQMALKRFPTG
jgi:acyl-coenzyme A thioesterase PaaI-like protein